MSANHVLSFYGLFFRYLAQMTHVFCSKNSSAFFAKILGSFRSRQWLCCGSWAYWALWSRLKLWKMRSGTNGAWSRAFWRLTFQFQILCDNGEVIWSWWWCFFCLGGVSISEWYFTSHSCAKIVSSKDMAFSAGTAEGRQFVFEKGQTTMTSQLAMASSSLLVSGCQRFNRCLTGVGRFHGDGWFVNYIHPSNTEMEHGNAWTSGQFLYFATPYQ